MYQKKIPLGSIFPSSANCKPNKFSRYSSFFSQARLKLFKRLVNISDINSPALNFYAEKGKKNSLSQPYALDNP